MRKIIDNIKKNWAIWAMCGYFGLAVALPTIGWKIGMGQPRKILYENGREVRIYEKDKAIIADASYLNHTVVYIDRGKDGSLDILVEGASSPRAGRGSRVISKEDLEEKLFENAEEAYKRIYERYK